MEQTMTQVLTKNLTKEEHVDLEEKSGKMFELVNGEPIERDMAKLIHEKIIVKLIALLSNFLDEKNFDVLSSNVKIAIPSNGNYRYADVSVVKSSDADEQDDATDKPVVLFEVLSKSTEMKDRGEKLTEYRTLPTLMEYVIIASEKVQIDLYRRKKGNDWADWEHIGLTDKAATLELRSVGFSTTLGTIYKTTSL
jgi:Uma2 family endonuclease